MNKRTGIHRFDREIRTERTGMNTQESIDLTVRLGQRVWAQEYIDSTVKCGQSEQEQTYRKTLI